MAKESHSNGAPTNGGSINNFDTFGKTLPEAKRNHGSIAKAAAALPPVKSDAKTDKAIRKWARSKTPAMLYKAMFSGKSFTQEQIMRQSINTTVKAVPQSVVGLLQRKIKGAITRIEHRRAEIQMCRVALKTGTVVKRGRLVKLKTGTVVKRGGLVAISPAEKKSFQQKKLQAQADLIAATQDLIVFRTQLTEAFAKNTTPVKANIKTVRELAYVKRMTPSVARQVIDFVDSKTGVREQLITLKRDTPGDDVPAGFLNIVKDSGDKTYNLLTAKPKLATQVRQRVFEQISQSK
jgi:hypothetical protein